MPCFFPFFMSMKIRSRETDGRVRQFSTTRSLVRTSRGLVRILKSTPNRLAQRQAARPRLSRGSPSRQRRRGRSLVHVEIEARSRVMMGGAGRLMGCQEFIGCREDGRAQNAGRYPGASDAHLAPLHPVRRSLEASCAKLNV